MDDLQALLALAMQHKWIAFAALAIGTLVRLTKNDTTFPVNIPPRWRIWLTFLLGVASGVVQKMTQGTPWKEAIGSGLVSSVLAIVGHNVVIASLRGGKEFVVPGMTIPGATPGPNKPTTLRPPANTPPKDPPSAGGAGGALLCFVAFLLAIVAGCSGGAKSPERHMARAAVVTMAEGLSLADKLCAATAQETKSVELAAKCREAYDIARPALIAAADGVDAWSSGAEGKTACAVKKAAGALSTLTRALEEAKVKLPGALVDSLALAPAIAGVCHE